MATSTEIKQRANTLADKNDVNSITPKEVGGIMYDLASHGENVLRNGGTLGIRKVYESVAAMEADSTNPKDFWGDPIKKGNLVVIYDGTTTGVDNNKIYAFMKPGWQIATHLDAGYATKAGLDAAIENVLNSLRNSEKALNGSIDSLEETVTENKKEVDEKLSELGSEVNDIELASFGELSHVITLVNTYHSSNDDKLFVNLSAGKTINVAFNSIEGISSTQVQLFFMKGSSEVHSQVILVDSNLTYTLESDIDNIGVYFEGAVGGKAVLTLRINDCLAEFIEKSEDKSESLNNFLLTKIDGKIQHQINFDGHEHSSSLDRLNIKIIAGTSFRFMIQDKEEVQPSGNYGVYTVYSDGTSELYTVSNINIYYTLKKDKDIVALGVYKEKTVQGTINLIVTIEDSLTEQIVTIEDSLTEQIKRTMGKITQTITLASNYHSSAKDLLRINLSEGDIAIFTFANISGVTSSKVNLYFRTSDGEDVDYITLTVGSRFKYTAISHIDTVGVYFEGEVGGSAILSVDVDNDSLYDTIENHKNDISALESMYIDNSKCDFIVGANTPHSSSIDRVFMRLDVGERFKLSIMTDIKIDGQVAVYSYHQGVSTLLDTLRVNSGITKTYIANTPITSIGVYYNNDSESDVKFTFQADRITSKSTKLDYNVDGVYGFTYHYDGSEHSSSLDRVIIRIKNNALKLRVLSSVPDSVPNMQVFVDGNVASNTINKVGLYDLLLSKEYTEFEDVVVGVYIAPKSPNQDFIFEYYTGGSNLIDSEPVKNDLFATYFNGTEEVESYLYFTDPHTMSRNYQGKSAFDNHMNHIKNIADGNPINFVMCGGDWLNNMDTQDEACAKLAYIRARMNSFNVQGYNVVGNHDLNYMGRLDSSSEQYTGTLTEATVGNLWYGCKKTYYDFHTKQTRVYVLDTGTDSHHVDASSLTRYEIEQCQWLCKSLSDNKDDKHIILSFHIYYVNQIVPYFVETLIDIISTYNSRGSYEINGESYDFVDNVGVVHCCICGHSHMDFNVVNKGIPVIGTTIASEVYDGYYDGGSIVTLDLVLLDYTRKKFRSVRYGNGENRDIDIL